MRGFVSVLQRLFTTLRFIKTVFRRKRAAAQRIAAAAYCGNKTAHYSQVCNAGCRLVTARCPLHSVRPVSISIIFSPRCSPRWWRHSRETMHTPEKKAATFASQRQTAIRRLVDNIFLRRRTFCDYDRTVAYASLRGVQQRQRDETFAADCRRCQCECARKDKSC